MAPRKNPRGTPQIAIPSQAIAFGGFGYDHAEANKITRTLCECMTFADGELKDPSAHRYHVQRDPRSILASLCGSLALALVGARTELTELEAKRARRDLWRQKERRQYMAAIKALQALGPLWAKEVKELEQEVKRWDEVHAQNFRITEKEICDNVLLQCRDLIKQYTHLRGDPAWKKVGDVLDIIEVVLFNGSDIAPLLRRFDRLSPVMKKNWKERNKARHST